MNCKVHHHGNDPGTAASIRTFARDKFRSYERFVNQDLIANGRLVFIGVINKNHLKSARTDYYFTTIYRNSDYCWI